MRNSAASAWGGEADSGGGEVCTPGDSSVQAEAGTSPEVRVAWLLPPLFF